MELKGNATREDLTLYLETLMLRVEQTRAAQEDYWRNNSSGTALKKARGLEAALDQAIKNLNRHGFSTDHLVKKASKQGRLL